MQLTAAEIKDLAEMAGFKVETFEEYDPEQEFTVQDCPALGVKDDDGVPRHYAHIAWDSEYPEEGVMPLGVELPPPPADVCPKCKQAWEEHEFGIPAPYCP